MPNPDYRDIASYKAWADEVELDEPVNSSFSDAIWNALTSSPVPQEQIAALNKLVDTKRNEVGQNTGENHD